MSKAAAIPLDLYGDRAAEAVSLSGNIFKWPRKDNSTQREPRGLRRRNAASSPVERYDYGVVRRNMSLLRPRGVFS